MDPRRSAGGPGGRRRRLGRVEARRRAVRADVAAGPRADGPRVDGSPWQEAVRASAGRTTGTSSRVLARVANRRRAHRRPEEAVARTDGGDGAQPEDRAEASRAPFTRGTLVHYAPARKPRRLGRARVYDGGIRGGAHGRPAPGLGRRLPHQRATRTSRAVPPMPRNRSRGRHDADCARRQAPGDRVRQRLAEPGDHRLAGSPPPPRAGTDREGRIAELSSMRSLPAIASVRPLKSYPYPRNASTSMLASATSRSRSNRSVPTTMLGVPLT